MKRLEDCDDLDAEELALLNAALDAAADEMREGKSIPVEQVIAKLRRGDYL